MTQPPCAGVSVGASEPLSATASIVRGWLLLEQPGAWGREALLESRLPAELAASIEAQAARHRVRVLLLRRQNWQRDTPRESFVASSRRPSPWIERRPLTDPAEVLSADLAAVAAGRPAGYGDPWPGPLYLVCTNGRHDPCCARLGRPVVRVLHRHRPEATWECSHLGGDRFAGNLLCLPHGLYFGRLGPDEARIVVDEYEAGRIHLDHYRGRAGDPFVVQAADHFIRSRRGLFGIDEVVPTSTWRDGPAATVVALALPGGEEVVVRVAAGPPSAPRLLTCTAVRPGRPARYAIRGPFPLGGGGSAVH